MYVHSVKLINYKSIGNYTESEIIIEPRVTAIIGKNESGKRRKRRNNGDCIVADQLKEGRR